MTPSRDPFGFRTSKRARSEKPLVVVAQPGQEIRIVVPDEEGSTLLPGDSRTSPKGSGDSRTSPKGSGDSRTSPKGSGDVFSQDAFGFKTYRRGFSPSPVTILAQSGQEIRIVVPRAGEQISGPPGDSRASPKGSGDSR